MKLHFFVRLFCVRAACALAAFTLLPSGCGKSGKTGTSDPPAKLRLERVLEFYRGYLDDKKQPPPDQAALQEYIRALPEDRKQGFGMEENLDKLFTSPRDNKPYWVRYKLRFDAGGETQAIAWEQDGKDGMRFVALSNGYVEEYTEADFNELKRE